MATTWKRIEFGLVLQGGGALGAYEWGAIEGLFGLMDRVEEQGTPISLKAVTGVSIGAINGACIVGAESRPDGLKRLAALWNDFKLETPIDIRADLQSVGLPSFAPARDLSLFGLPGFYMPRTDVWNFSRWTSLYDTKPLEATLRKHISFKKIDSSDTTFIVTAVDVESGKLKRFRNEAVSDRQNARKTPEQKAEEKDDPVVFAPHHILASGSLAPQFPWTEIDKRFYWDGGVVDTTPLGDAMGSFSPADDVYRLVVVMNLYPLSGRAPTNLLGVSDRVHELSYGNRLRQDRSSAKRINNFVRTIEMLDQALKKARVPVGPELEKCVADATKYKVAKIVDVDFQTGGDPIDDTDGLRDFAPNTVEKRRGLGKIYAWQALAPVLVEEGFLPKQPVEHAAAATEH